MNYTIVIFNIILVLCIIIIIVCGVLNLIQISKIPGYAGSPSLKNAYNYSFFTLGFGIFGLTCECFVIFTLIYNKYNKTRETLFFETLVILSFIGITVFSALCIFNSSTTYAILNLSIGILGLILGIVYLYIINRLPRKLNFTDLVEKEYNDAVLNTCKNIKEKSTCELTGPREPVIPDVNTNTITTLIAKKEKEPYYDYL